MNLLTKDSEICKCLYLSVISFNVSNRSFEPFSCIQDPPKHYQTQTYTQSNRCIVECIPRNWVVRREEEDRTGITNPEEGNQANRPTCFPQIKWPSFEVLLSHYHSCKDWNCISSYPSYCTYRSYGSEDDIDFQDWKSKENADGRTQPHCIGRNFVFWVQFLPYG